MRLRGVETSHEAACIGRKSMPPHLTVGEVLPYVQGASLKGSAVVFVRLSNSPTTSGAGGRSRFGGGARGSVLQRVGRLALEIPYLAGGRAGALDRRADGNRARADCRDDAGACCYRGHLPAAGEAGWREMAVRGCGSALSGARTGAEGVDRQVGGKTWVPGSSPAMTAERAGDILCRRHRVHFVSSRPPPSSPGSSRGPTTSSRRV